MDLGAFLFSRTERVSKMRITYETDGFRKYEPIIAQDKSGKNIKMILCEELDPETGCSEQDCAVCEIHKARVIRS